MKEYDVSLLHGGATVQPEYGAEHLAHREAMGGFTEHLLLIEVEKLNCHIHMLQVLITSGGTTGLHISPLTAGNPILDQSVFQEPLCRWTLK